MVHHRPTDLEIGADGSLLVSDWCNVLIGHMQHNMRDPNRDHEHGRIYRITHRDGQLLPPVRLKGRPLPEVIKALASKEKTVRYRAKLELSGRDSSAVASAIDQMTESVSGDRSADCRRAGLRP